MKNFALPARFARAVGLDAIPLAGRFPAAVLPGGTLPAELVRVPLPRSVLVHVAHCIPGFVRPLD